MSLGENKTDSRLEKHYKLYVFLLLTIFIFTCTISAYNDSATTDEPEHILFGQRILDGGLEHASMQRMPITALNAIPIAIIKPEGASARSQYTLWLCRLPSILFSAVLGLCIFTWSKKLYGIKGGLLSLFMYVFCPNTVAHSRLATTDMYCALFMFLSVFSFVNYLRNKTWPKLVSSALMMGIAQLTKHTALLLFPVLFSVFCFHLLFNALSRHGKGSAECLKQLKTAAVHGLAYLFVVAVVINAGYGFKGSGTSLEENRSWLASAYPSLYKEAESRSDINGSKLLSKIPLPLPRAYIEAFILGQYYNKTGKGHGPIYLLGNLSQYGWWYYFPVAFLLKTPLPSMLLFAMGIYLMIKNRQVRSGTDEIYLLFLVIATFIFFCFFCTAQIGIRYILPAMPFIYVLSGQVAAWKPEKRHRLGKTCFIILLLWLPVSFFSFFPHYISYFNEFCPDRLRLYKYLADSNLDWGQNVHYLRRYINAHQKGKIIVNPSSPATGTIIVNVNSLVGVTTSPSRYAWLRNNYSPVEHVGYSWLIYEIPE